MAVISKLSEEVTTKEQNYPKLMISDTGSVVLFSIKGCGTLIKCSNGNIIGHMSERWDMEEFEDYHGTVTLQNKKGE